MFLIRTAFWLSIVILLLPAPKAEDNGEQAGISASQVFDAAKATVEHMSTVCERSPDVCETGRAAAETFGNKARYGAQLLMDYVSDEAGEAGDAPTAAPAAAPRSFAPQVESQNTLNSGDLEPRWGGPLGNNNA